MGRNKGAIMNEWKELKKNKLPEDILGGAYEWEWFNQQSPHAGWKRKTYFDYHTMGSFLEAFELGNINIRYRRSEPEVITQKEEHLERVRAARRVFGLTSDEHSEAISDSVQYILSREHSTSVILELKRFIINTVNEAWETGRIPS